jgi:hypothetical protein
MPLHVLSIKSIVQAFFTPISDVATFRMLTDNVQNSVYVVLFDFSNAVPKFNDSGRLTFARDSG